MAQWVYTPAMIKMLTEHAAGAGIPLTGGLAASTSTDPVNYQMMLIMTAQTTTAHQQDATVSASSGLNASELVATTGYTGGWIQTPAVTRRQLCTVTATNNTASTNVVNCYLNGGSAMTWTAVSGANAIVACALIKSQTNDTNSVPIAYWDFSPTLSLNGSNIQLTLTGPNITFTT